MVNKVKQFDFVMVEDNPGDVFLLRRALDSPTAAARICGRS